MSAPYASVVLPTHDRHAALAYALPSAQAQSVENIEILVACDGATPQVLDVAHAAAGHDPRISVLDLPKGTNRGGEARAVALEAASSDRILILQDDDLWFPNHVAVLGGALDNHDVVTAGTLAVRLSGSVAAWASNYESPEFREIARRTGYKLVFEAHYGFSMASYRRLDVAWDRLEAGGNIGHLLRCHLADPDARWASITTPTALSFNSPTRYHRDEDSRAAELAPWAARIGAGMAASDVVATAQWGGAMWAGMAAHGPRPEDTLDSYLAQLGLSTAESPPHSGLLGLALPPDQRRHLEVSYDLATSQVVSADGLLDAALDLSEPFAGPEPRSWQVAELLIAALGHDGAADLVHAGLDSIPPTQLALPLGLLTSLSLQRGNHSAAAAYLERWAVESDDYPAYREQLVGVMNGLAAGS